MCYLAWDHRAAAAVVGGVAAGVIAGAAAAAATTSWVHRLQEAETAGTHITVPSWYVLQQHNLSQVFMRTSATAELRVLAS